MCDLNYREFYNQNEIKYTVKPEFITLGMACVSRFEDTPQWHRAMVQKIVDEDNVIVNTIYYNYKILITFIYINKETRLSFNKYLANKYLSQSDVQSTVLNYIE